jgi:hypothetical protein
MAVTALSSLEASAESSNDPGDLTKGKHLTIYVEGLADPSSGFFRVLNNGARRASPARGWTFLAVGIGTIRSMARKWPNASAWPRQPRRRKTVFALS